MPERQGASRRYFTILTGKGVPVTLRVWEDIGHQMPRDHTQVILDSVNAVLERE